MTRGRPATSLPRTPSVAFGAVAGSGEFDRAVVTYPAPHGAEAFTLCDGETACFGRGAECQIRFAYAPVADEGVPRIAGNLLAANGRIFIESATQPGHRALEIRSQEGTTAISAGEGFSPRGTRFDLLVRGEDATWKMSVTVRTTPRFGSAEPSADPPTRRFSLDLDERQYSVLAAYCEPPRRGRSEPATHKEVAAALNYHPNTVREILYEIWARMFELQVPMPDASDKRVAVVEAARVHGLLWNQNE